MSKARVLVIDDQADHAEAMVEALERAGHECTAATGGEEGLRLVTEDPDGVFDLVVTDLVMKDLSGHELLRRAKP